MPITKSDDKPARQPEQDKSDKPFISEGVRQEIESTGKAVDPATGRVLTKADLPK